MPASKSEQVLETLKALLETLPDATVQRNSVLPEKIPADGLIILRDGDPGEPEQALGGFGNAYYQHAVEIEVYVEEGDAAARDAAFDVLLQQIGGAIDADPTLGGLAFGITYGRPEPSIEAVAGAPAIKSGTLNAQQVDQLIAQSAAVRDAQLAQLRAKEVEAAEKVRAANERVVASLEAERQALAQTERERFVAQAVSRLSAEATAEQRREVEQLAGALFDEQQALQARQRLMDEGRSVIDRTRTATEQHAAEIQKLNELLAAGAIDLATYARAVEEANDRALRSSQAWTDGATRFLKDYVAESNDAATATERAFANAFGGAEDSLVGFISSGKLEFRSLADSILADLARTTVRQTITAPLAGALQSAFAGGGLFGLFHEGGVAGA